MSDAIKHECGIALIRLLKPLQYYQEKYGTALYGFYKLFLLMEKQHNRGQDGAGVGSLKLNMDPGKPYMFRERETKRNSLDLMFHQQLSQYHQMVKKGIIHPEFAQTVKEHFDFSGEILLGHLRYATSGGYKKRACHPYLRRSNWPTRNLMLAGNFNLTNTGFLHKRMVERGQHPIFDTDTQTILEEIGFFLDQEHASIYRQYRDEGVPGKEIADRISTELDLVDVLRKSCQLWDGGWTLAGLVGNGDAFVMRDPWGIRPCFYFANDEIVAVASEQVPLMTVFDQKEEDVHELKRGNALVIRHTGGWSEESIRTVDQAASPCSFERIYFSRGNDPEIYKERKALGAEIVQQVLKAVNHDLAHTVLSFIPNTSEVAYYGALEELRSRQRKSLKDSLLQFAKEGALTEDQIEAVFNTSNWVRAEKIAHKDVKLRTFISKEKNREELVSHVYDVTYGIVKPDDNLVCIDDSIVRGTTLRKSILGILARLHPKKIIIASTAPQIRYPDCYGIDMSELGKFIAFQAAIALLKERGQQDIMQQVYADCVKACASDAAPDENLVKRIYAPFRADEISQKISQLVYPGELDWEGEIQILFQGIESLHRAIPNHHGDWYFTGDYPTPEGARIAHRAFIHFFENQTGRSYE